MKHIELHVISSVLDAALAGIAGLPQIDGERGCNSCGQKVGYLGIDRFHTVVIALGHEAHGFYCTGCAGKAIQL